MPFLAGLLPDFVYLHLGWWLFALSVVAGLAVGFGDFLRLSLKRIWAISGVCFDESIRRRVLWITPLAIVGVIVVSQLQRPLDEQDAIRQTTKFCIFATGLLVALTTIILACTNLPREIENRVIYTVVTKPTTRLEIVLGKVIGFARVSFVILLIMGVFSYGYLRIRAWSMRHAIAARLEDRDVTPTNVSSLTYYRDAGLLGAKTLVEPRTMQVFSRLPEESGTRRYMFGSNEGSFCVPFDITPQMITPPTPNAEPGENGLVFRVFVGYVKKGAATEPTTTTASASPTTAPTTKLATTGPTSRPYYGPYIMSPEERVAVMSGVRPSSNPLVAIEVEDANFNNIGQATPFPPAKQFELLERSGLSPLFGVIDPKVAKQLNGRVYVRVTGGSPDTEYYVDLKATPSPVALAMPVGPGQEPMPIPAVPAADNPSRPAQPIFQSRRTSNDAQQLRGGTERIPTGVVQFHDVKVASDEEGNAAFEMRCGIEHSNEDDSSPEVDRVTRVSVVVRNRATQTLSDEVIVQPESNRTVFFKLPAAALAGGNFDLLVRCITSGDFVAIGPRSIVLVAASQPFVFNLIKSLTILWLMTVLITAVAIFCSTFLSWPIAVVLTIVILLGHWGVEQLGDATAPGIGNQVVMDFGLKSPAKAEAVRATVEKLSSFLNFISTILPDISRYSAVEEIERGVAIPAERLREALLVTLGFGVPLVLLAYVFLKNKEVAP
jgi:hypothetical protein